MFYQLVSSSNEDMLKEAHLAKKIAEDQLVLKISPTEQGFQIIKQLPPEIPCCITALYSAAQAVVARESGVRYIAVYVNRSTKFAGRRIIAHYRHGRCVLKGSQTQILAASLKSPTEASAAILSGTGPFNPSI